MTKLGPRPVVVLASIVVASIVASTTAACSGGGASTASQVPSRRDTSATVATTGSQTSAARAVPPVSGPVPSLLDELASVPEPSADGGGFDVDYVDLSSLRSVGAIAGGSSTTASTVAAEWTGVVQVGLGAFGSVAGALPGATGLNPLLANAAAAYQEHAALVTRLDGNFDATSIARRLLALGAHARKFGSSAGLSFGADNSSDTTSALSTDLGYTDPVPQWELSSSSVLTSPSGATLAASTSGRRSVGGLSPVRQVVACLGDVVAAEVAMPADPRDSALLVAAGVARPGSASGVHREVMCVLPKPGEQARIRQGFTARLATTSPDVIATSATGVPLGATVSQRSVDQPGSLVRVRLTLRPGADAGYLIGGLQNDTLLYWDGSCPLAARRDPSVTC